jgi:TatD DNase family protein
VIDTHAHLDLCEDSAAAVERARAAGVTRVLTVGTGPGSWPAALALAERHEGVAAVLGIHPHEAGAAADEDLDELRRLQGDGRCVAVGEAGLDFYRDYAPRDAQRRLFVRTIELASELAKPLVVHTRAADEETVSLLAGFEGTVVLHCFSSPPLLRAAVDRGYYVSFAGNVTYPKAGELRAAAREVPADRILAETDTPYLAPQPRRGRPSEPADVVHTLRALAETRHEEPDELERRIEANALRAFGLS